MAQAAAESLKKRRIIEDYFIIQPKDYAVSRAKIDPGYSLRDSLTATAHRFIGRPYCWGGTTPEEGFDCSGLVMAVYRLNGINLPRSSKAQFKTGRPVKKSELKHGDILFFATGGNRRTPSHVGIYIGRGRFIHAPKNNNSVREDSLSNSYFKSRYLGARSYL